MVREYQRRTQRCSYGEEAVQAALAAIREGMKIYTASKTFGIPRRTLQQRLQKDPGYEPKLGRPVALGAGEEELVQHLLKLESKGFPLTMADTKRLAYQYAKKKGIPHPFSSTRESAGYDWLYGVLQRHPNISVRKAQPLSYGRADALSKEECRTFYNLLEAEMTDSNGDRLLPSHIFNCDETGLQLIFKPGKVLAEKGKRAVQALTTGERGETVTVMGCISASGSYIPPFIIFKGVRMREEFNDGLPPGSVVAMSDSGYMTEVTFMSWLKHFANHTPPGKVLLLLDGHSTHYSNVEAIEFCIANQISLLCLPSHTTHWLQPLDRAIYKPLKLYWNEQCSSFIRQNRGRKITKFVFGRLFAAAWGKAATVGSAVNGFRACGIYPINPDAIPASAFYTGTETGDLSVAGLSQEPTLSDATCNVVDVPTASGSLESTLPQQPTPNVASTQTATLLDEIAPVPTRDGVRRLSPRSATRLTSPDHVEVLKSKQQTRLKGASQKKRGGVTQTMKRSPKTGVRSKVGANAAHSSHASSDPTNYCAVCNGYYYDVDLIKVGDWVKCVKCHKWCHEACLIQRTSNTLSRVCPSCVS